jgi:hypothetical protein
MEAPKSRLVRFRFAEPICEYGRISNVSASMKMSNMCHRPAWRLQLGRPIAQ